MTPFVLKEIKDNPIELMGFSEEDSGKRHLAINQVGENGIVEDSLVISEDQAMALVQLILSWIKPADGETMN